MTCKGILQNGKASYIYIIADQSSTNTLQYPVIPIFFYWCPPGFYPTFLFVDSVTEERSVFMGQYTLRAIAGGSSEDNMRPFSLTDIV